MISRRDKPIERALPLRGRGRDGTKIGKRVGVINIGGEIFKK